MRFDALHLSAVGPFTDRRLDLSAGAQGVHVLYGPNEAGKSSALRAVYSLLFGFHPQTRDDFVHRYDKLRVGADLRTSTGQQLTVFRRKGRKSTLLGADGEALPEDCLVPFLGGVNEAVFASQFGIDHDALLAGGKALVEQHGDEAQALFGASLGNNRVHAVLESLDAEAQALFVPRGATRTINKLLAEIEDLRKLERAATLQSSQFDDARRAVDEARSALAAADRERDEATREHARLTRIQAVQAPLARRARALRVLEQHAALAELPEDFASRRQDAAQRLRDAGTRAARAAKLIESLAERAGRIAVRDAVLSQDEAIERVLERLSVIEQAAVDRVTLASDHARLQADLTRLRARLAPALRALPLDGIEAHLGRQRRGEELAGEHATLVAALDSRTQQCLEIEQQRAALHDTLAALPEPADLAPLRQAVHAARRAGDLDEQIVQMEGELADLARSEQQDLHALGRWSRDLEALLSAPLPDPETVLVWQARLDDLHDRGRRIAERREDARARREAAEEALQVQSMGVAPPTEQQLEHARAHRDTGWALLRARWIDGKDIDREAREYAGDADLADVFEAGLAGADALADRLRREAAAVHERATRAAARDAAVGALDALAVSQCELDAELARFAIDWQAVWTPVAIAPASPVEMIRWRQRAEQIKEQARIAISLRERCGRAMARRERLCEDLRTALAATSGAPADRDAAALAPALERGESQLARLEAMQGARAMKGEELSDVQRRCRRHRDELAAARAALEAWQQRWAAFTGALELPSAVTPGELRDHFDLLREVADVGDRAARDGARLADIDADAAAFAAAIRELCARVTPELEQHGAAHAARELKRILEQQRKARVERASLHKQQQDAQRELDEARTDLAEAECDLARLCAQAGGVDAQALETVERHDQERRTARQLRDEAELELADLGAGATPDALARDASRYDPDELAARIGALHEHLEQELVPRRDGLIRDKQDAERTLEAMSGAGEAALIAQQREQRLAELATQSRYHVRLRLAAMLLREQMERLRRDHSDPILGRAGAYLGTLTTGSYTAVQTAFDAADHAVLCAVRSTGEAMPVEALSNGTRDQLYLALRLATLELQLRSAEPLPFVVDDILVQFDDARTRATLQALSAFSRRTQVLVFTHHERVADDALRLAEQGEDVFVHRLEIS